MSALSEKYYGNKKVAVVLSKAGFMNNAFSGIRKKNGYFGICNNTFEFKDFLPKPGIDESDEFSDPDYYFDSYEEVKEFGIEAFVIDAFDVYSDNSDSIRRFNDEYSTNFVSFDEIYDYAASDGRWTDNDEYEDYGLSFSSNVVEDFRSAAETHDKEDNDDFAFNSIDSKLLDTGNNKKAAVLYEADDCETIYGVLDADFAEEIRSATRHSDYPVGCLEATDSEPSRDGNYYVLIDNNAYEVVGLFSSENNMREYMSDNDIEDYQFYICQKGHFLGWNDKAVSVINELRETSDFKDADIYLHLKDEFDEIDYEFDRTFASDDKPKNNVADEREETTEDLDEKYKKALGNDFESWDWITVAACHSFFIDEVMDAMDEQELDEENDVYHTERNGFIFKDCLPSPAELVQRKGTDLPPYTFESFNEVEEFNYEERSIILTRKNSYLFAWEGEDDDVLREFNEHFGTNFNSFAECWNYVLDKKNGKDFKVLVFHNGEIE